MKSIRFLLVMLLLAAAVCALSSCDIVDKLPFEIPFLSTYNIPLLAETPGGFLVFGFLIAIVNKIGPKKGEGKRKEFSCEGCPSAALCGKVTCSDSIEITANSIDKEEKI